MKYATKHYQRWTLPEIIEFCQYYPDYKDELAEYFQRKPLAIVGLANKYNRLVEIGLDPTILHFPMTMYNLHQIDSYYGSDNVVMIKSSEKGTLYKSKIK